MYNFSIIKINPMEAFPGLDWVFKHLKSIFITIFVLDLCCSHNFSIKTKKEETKMVKKLTVNPIMFDIF